MAITNLSLLLIVGTVLLTVALFSWLERGPAGQNTTRRLAGPGTGRDLQG